MAKLQRYTQISHGFGEEGPGYSFVNLAYNEDNESTEDIERRWTFEDETKFKPRKNRCTKFNVAVAVFILAAGGLAVFLIVKLSQDHEKVYTTPQPGPLGGSTKIPSTTSSLPSTSETLTSTTMETSKTTVTMHTTMMTSSSPTAPPTSTSGPPLTRTLSTPSSTQTTTTNSSKSPTSTPITAPSPTTTTRPSTTSTSPLSTTMLTATTTVQTSSTPTPITKTTLSSVTTAAPQLSTDSSTETTTTIPTTTSGTNTTSQSLMTTTSLPENSTATATTIITSSTSASTIPSATTTPIPKSSSGITTLLPTTTATSNVVTTTQEITTHTTANGTNNTEDASMMFDASMTVTSIAWDENYSNSSSDAYQKLISNFTNQVEEGIKSSEVGSSFSHVTITAVSPGSVVFDFRIHMTSSSYQSGGSQETITHSVVSTVLVKIVQRAKVNGTETMLSGVNETNIVVQTVIEITKSLPSTTTKMMTALPTATTLKESESTSSQTTATTPTVTTTTMSTTISPCANSTYLSSTLISFCFDSSRLNEVVNASEVVKCRYILSAVDCVLDKIRLDFGINCTNEHKLAALNEFTGIVQLYLGIDPENCDLPVTMPTTMATKTSSSGPATPSPGGMTTSKPTMKTPFPTSISPCTNSSYLSMTLLSNCINLTQINEVAKASDSIKCNFILSAVDCVLDKIRLDFGINCTNEHKLAALNEFTGIVQLYLGIDPENCDLPVTMPTTMATKTSSSGPATPSPGGMTTSKPTMKTPFPTSISPCTNSSYLSMTLLSNCINLTQINEVANASDSIKCNFILSAVDCVLDKIRLDFGINCTNEHKLAALKEFTGIVQLYLGIDPEICDLPVTMSTTLATKTSSSGPATPSPGGMTTSKPTMTTPFPISISPCNNSAYLSSTLLSHCINSSQINEVANALDRVKCRFILSAVDCVLEKIRLDFEINCTEENELAALEEFSGIVQSYLLIDPEICVLPIIMSSTTTELSPQTTIRQPSTTKTTTQSSTTAMQSVATSPITTRLTTTTGPTTVNPCMNSTYLSLILSQSSCIADSNQLEEVKNASDEVKCNYISSIVDCVLDGVHSDINITCSDKKKIVVLYEIEELSLSYLSIDPSTCDLSVTNSTTTPSARTTLSPAATTAMITTTPVTTMTSKTTKKLTTPPPGTTMTTKTTNKLTTPPPRTTTTAMKTTPVTTTS